MAYACRSFFLHADSRVKLCSLISSHVKLSDKLFQSSSQIRHYSSEKLTPGIPKERGCVWCFGDSCFGNINQFNLRLFSSHNSNHQETFNLNSDLKSTELRQNKSEANEDPIFVKHIDENSHKLEPPLSQSVEELNINITASGQQTQDLHVNNDASPTTASNSNNDRITSVTSVPAQVERSSSSSDPSAGDVEVTPDKDVPVVKRRVEPSYYLAPFVAQSHTLQQLVRLGVDLSKVETVREAADFLVQSNWEADIRPKLFFLRDVGVSDADLGTVLSKNPLILTQDLESMQACVDYLQSKRFQTEQLSRIFTKAPLTLSLTPLQIDRKLGFLQNSFKLSGDEVRLVATRLPKLLPWRLQKLKDIRFYIKEYLGFSDREQKAMLLDTPKLYISDKHQLGKRFDFVHNTMGLSHAHLVQWPGVFRSRLHILQYRHRFLLLLGRAQYDPAKENYVSLKALVSGRDREFCQNVAKVSVEQFRNFQKSI